MRKPKTRIKNQRINQGAFLAAFAECANVSRAVEIAGIHRSSHYRWLNEDEGYREAFRETEEMAVDRLEEEARRRAIYGVEKPVFYRGQQCGVVREYSDRLLIVLLKAARPEKYQDHEVKEVKAQFLRIIIEGDLDEEIYGAGNE